MSQKFNVRRPGRPVKGWRRSILCASGGFAVEVGVGVRALALASLAGLLALSGCGRGARSAFSPPQAEDYRSTTNAPEPSRLKPGQAPLLKLQLDRSWVSAGGAVSGRLVGTWNARDFLLRLVWIDGSGRVVSDASVERRPDQPGSKALAFSVALDGGIGSRNHLAALLAPRPKKKKYAPLPSSWFVAARADFYIRPAPQPWAGFPVLVPWQRPNASAIPSRFRLRRYGLNGVVVKTSQAARAWAERDVPFLVDGMLPDPAHPLRALGHRAWSGRVKRFSVSRDPAVWARRPELFDEQALSAAFTNVERGLRPFQNFQPLGYSVGRELSLGFGTYPVERMPGGETLALFQAWLRQRYGTLAALNAHWGRSFARWSAIRPPTTDQAKAGSSPRYARRLAILKKGDPEKRLPRKSGRPYFTFKVNELKPPGGENFTAWCDSHAFSDFAFARLLREFRARAKRQDARARVGLSGLFETSAWGGYDWARVGRALDWCLTRASGPHPALLGGLHPALVRLARLDLQGPEARRRLWRAWLDGARGAVLRGAGALFGEDTGKGVQADGKFAGDFRLLNGGLTRQRDLAREDRGAVALYYSPRSVAVHWLLDSKLDGSTWPRRGGADARRRNTALRALRAWIVLLRDLGYEPGFVERERLLRGGLRAKVLILPKVLCLSDREAEALKAFAHAGGLVLADSQCGLFDGGGRRRPLPPGGGAAGVLDEAFGIRRKDYWAHELDGKYFGQAPGARVFLEDLVRPVPVGPSSRELRINEPGVRATSAWQLGRARGGGAALMTRAHGLGRFAYLNLALQDYPALREKAAADFQYAGWSAAQYAARFGPPRGGEALRVAVGGLLEEFLGEAPLAVRSMDGLPLRGVRRVRWRGGPVTLIALLDELPRRSRGPDVRVVYNRRRHWYDARRGSYLGLGTDAVVSLPAGQAAVLAALPYRVRAISSRIRRLDPRGAFRIELALETKRDGAEGKGAGAETPGRHVLRVEVFDPAGRHLPHYTRQVVAKRGRWSGTFSLGLNEPPGNYRWTVQDVLTGTRAVLQLRKDRSRYAHLFKPRVELPKWRLEPRRNGTHLAGQGGQVTWRQAWRLVPLGLNLAGTPGLSVEASMPWRAEVRSGPRLGPVLEQNPRPDPYPLELRLLAERQALSGAVPASVTVAVRTRAGRQVLAVPLRFARIAPRGKKPLKLDGKLDDSAWGTAPQSMSFARAGGRGPARSATSVYLRYDARYLFIGARCANPARIAPRSTNQTPGLNRQSPRVKSQEPRAKSQEPNLNFARKPGSDWLEVAVAGPAKPAKPFESSGTAAGGDWRAPLRVRVDREGRVWRPRRAHLSSANPHKPGVTSQASRAKSQSPRARSQEPGAGSQEPIPLRAAVAKDSGGWSAELAIPWSALGREGPPAPGAFLRLGFERVRREAGRQAEHSTWRFDPAASSTEARALGVGLIAGK